MSTSAKIKSAIRSKGSSQRKAISSLSDVSSRLSEADFSSKIFEIKSKQSEEAFDTVFSGIDALATLAGGLEQKAELESNIKVLEGELGEGQQFKIKQKPKLMDVFKKDVTLSDYLTSEDQYFLGDKSFGSKYDVAALGSKIKSERDAAALLSKSIETNTISEIGLDTLESPKVSSITGRSTPLQERNEGSGLSGLESPKSLKSNNKITPEEYLKKFPNASNSIKAVLDPNYKPNSFEDISLIGQEESLGFDIPENTDEYSLYDSTLLDDKSFELFADKGFK